MIATAPDQALTSASNNWGIYMTYAVQSVLDGTEIPADWCKGFSDGAVLITYEKVVQDIQEVTERYGFELDPNQKIYDMSVSQKQTVEIVKMLYRGANILILDEPTAVLTPQETEKLFTVLRNMRDQGKSIIIITHKLNEVLALSDRVSVLRKGKYIGTVETKNATAESLTEMMVGEKIDLNIERPDPVNPVKRLVIENLSCVNKEGVKTLKNASMEAYGGEILGIAGLAGSGQKELLEAVAGLQMTESGSVRYITEDGEEKELLSMKPADIKNWELHYPSCRRTVWEWDWLVPWE